MSECKVSDKNIVLNDYNLSKDNKVLVIFYRYKNRVNVSTVIREADGYIIKNTPSSGISIADNAQITPILVKRITNDLQRKKEQQKKENSKVSRALQAKLILRNLGLK